MEPRGAWPTSRRPRSGNRKRVGARVDVLLQNHMLMAPIQEKLDKLAIRKKGESNPFVVGATEYQKFLDVMEGCTRVNLARRKLLLRESAATWP